MDPSLVPQAPITDDQTNLIQPSPAPRKRRRPALSCEQCRRRKIKCDRCNPCGQCIQSKSATCSYTSEPPPAIRKSRVEARTSPGSASGNHQNMIYLESASFKSPINEIVLSDHEKRPDLGWPMLEADNFTKDADSGPTFDKLTLQMNQMRHMTPCSAHVEVAEKEFFQPMSKGPGIRGVLSKTRLYGQSHWINCFERFEKLASFKTSAAFNKNSEIYYMLQKCKSMARQWKEDRAQNPLMPQRISDFIPPREISDKLVDSYFRTYETMFRILHIPSFQKEYSQYWENPAAANASFLMKLLLVLAIGTCFHEEFINSLYKESLQWVNTAQAWLSSPGEKSRLNISCLQVHCLLLIARQTSGVNGDLTWMSSGHLLHLAMTLGMHRDPMHFSKMSPFHREMRRRLWATVLELVVQSSQDLGLAPLVSFEDHDCDPPSNIDDDQIGESISTRPVPKPMTTFTQTTVQIALFRSLNTRLKISKLINGARSSPTYEDTLQLDTELTSSIRSNTQLFQSYLLRENAKIRPTTFQIKFLDLLTRRFLILLHYPWFVEAKDNPRFYFSRKVCVESSVVVLQHRIGGLLSRPETPATPDDFTLFMYLVRGGANDTLIHASMIIGLELVTLLEDEPRNLNPSMTAQFSMNSNQISHLLVTFKSTLELVQERLERGETNVKAVIFVACMIGQVEAQLNGADPETAIIEAAKNSVQECYELLKRMLGGISPKESSLVFPVGSEVVDSNSMMSWDLLMQDTNTNFDMPDSWLFSGWNDSSSWVS